MTQIEKERKWLLKALPLLDYKEVIYIMQYYWEGWRYRCENSLTQMTGPKYYKLKKVKVGEGINQEVDITEIDKTQFYSPAYKATGNRKISKNRYIFPFGDKKIEIDVFEGDLRLVIMEIEEVEIGDQIDLPEEIKELILMEVTGNPIFDNYNLAL